MSHTQLKDRSTRAPSLRNAEERSAQLEAGFHRDPARFRVLTGDRPTGPLHLGHYFGTLLNRVRLQDLGVETIVLVADYQTITDRDSPASLPNDVEELVADYLAVGIDPERTTIFAHSQVPELNQLTLPFLSLVTVPELARNPTVKDERVSGCLGGEVAGEIRRRRVDSVRVLLEVDRRNGDELVGERDGEVLGHNLAGRADEVTAAGDCRGSAVERRSARGGEAEGAGRTARVLARCRMRDLAAIQHLVISQHVEACLWVIEPQMS